MSWTLGLGALSFGLALGVGWVEHGAPETCPDPPVTGYDVRYDGLSAVVVHPGDANERRQVIEFARELWSESWDAEELMVVVDPVGVRALRQAGIEFELRVPDIQAVADAERARLQEVDASRPGDWFADYKPFAAVDAYAGRLAELHPELVTIEAIGTSIEGRPIRALRITDTRVDAAQKHKIVLNGGQHAREWIAVMSTTCIADRLVHRATSDPRIATALEQHEFVIVPVVNPDGYVYSWEHDRYWRKNRRGHSGVDLNRNWDWAWGGPGSSRDPQSQIYAGTRAFSEPETRALRDLIVAEAPAAHVDLHSFSQLILYPWGHAREPAPEWDRFAAYADRMASAIYASDGKAYKAQASADLYVASGTLTDWAYGVQGVLSFVFELRPSPGGGGFVLPPEEIVPTCEEALAGVLELADLVERDG